MAFTFYNPPKLNPEEVSPFGNIIQNILKNYQEGAKAAYIKPTLSEELKKAQLYNKYYGPNMESEMGLRGAQAGHLGSMTEGQNIQNKYLEPKLQSELMQQMLQRQLQQNAMSFLNNQSNVQPQSETNIAHGQGMLNPEIINQQPPSTQSAQMDFTKAALLSKFLKLGEPHYVTSGGMTQGVTPFGTFDVAKGETTLQKEIFKNQAKQIGDLEDVVYKSQAKMDTFNELNSILGSPAFEAIRTMPAAGSLEGWLTKKFGSEQQQELVGKAFTLMGNIVKDSARDFAGQFRIGEQALLNGMKPNINDSLSVMKGKSEALTYLTQMIAKRSELEAESMRNGMSFLQAKKAADKAIDSEGIKKEIRTILHPSSSKIMITPEQAKIELERRRSQGK